ncbi:hypothetical protein EVAR_46531_1, partial [Eumeta japonica]
MQDEICYGALRHLPLSYTRRAQGNRERREGGVTAREGVMPFAVTVVRYRNENGREAKSRASVGAALGPSVTELEIRISTGPELDGNEIEVPARSSSTTDEVTHSSLQPPERSRRRK